MDNNHKINYKGYNQQVEMSEPKSVPAYVYAVATEQEKDMPVIILMELNGRRALPIWVGLLEAAAVASVLENVTFPRPMTHDLLTNILEKMGGTVGHIEITELKDDTYYAEVHIEHSGESFVLDARPSDAIAVALRTEASIFINEKVFEKARFVVKIENNQVEITPRASAKSWQELLEHLNPESFKYKM